VKVLGYDAANAAIITKKEGKYYARIKKVTGLEESPEFKVGSDKIIAYFRNIGRDFIWTKKENYSRVFSPPSLRKNIYLNFEHAAVDHLLGDALIVQNNTIKIYHFSSLLYTNAPRIRRIIPLKINCTDFTIVNAEIFCIHNFTIYKITENGANLFCPYFIGQFQFALFPKEIAHVTVCASSNEIYLYLIDIIFFIALAYLFKMKVTWTRTGSGNLELKPRLFHKEMTRLNEV
jgi:hypothetical protein